MQHWADQLNEHWGISARLSRLDGEYDLNFLAQTEAGESYVLKIMRPDCAEWLVDMQVEALRHIQNASSALPCPRVIPTPKKHLVLKLKDETGQERLVWLLERLAGKCYAVSAPKTDALISEIGATLGGVSKALQSFEHTQAERDFKWDLMRADWIVDEIQGLNSSKRRQLIGEICDAYADIKPALGELPKQVIHNDANDYNILIANI